MRSSVRAKTITVLCELFLINWCEFLCDRLLYYPVNNSGNSKLTKLAFCFFGYLYPPNGVWFISSIPYLLDQGFLVLS